jgi:coatomer protein complex subunit alpha (xenin)
MNSDLFGGGDAVVKYVLEGHDRGVNWASFHPTLPLIVSGADDRQVKLWRMNDTKAWEVDTLRGHVNNVSCVMFHARQDIIVSNSEDKSIRVWDMSKRTGVQTFRREHDRFWILSAHPEVNLLAAGHDSGMIVFKLERERPAYATHGGTLFYVKDRYLRAFEYASARDNPLVSIRRPGSPTSGVPRALSYNPAENAVLVSLDGDGGSYELHVVPKDSGGRGGEPPEAKRGAGTCATFVARNRFAVFDKSAHSIIVKNLRNEVTKKCPPPCAGTDAIFYAGTGALLCRSEDKVVLMDVQQRITIAELATPYVKYVVWSGDGGLVALLSKHAIVIANKRLAHACTVHETIRVKSGAWDEFGVFVYTTLNHIKYALPNGDSGIIRTLDVPVYITRVANSTVFCLDREGRNRQIAIDCSEYMFKLALVQRKYDQVLSMIKSNALCGQSIIAYLQQKGFPEVALHFVKDERTRFALAVECGNIEVALASAQELDDKETWHRLGVEALRQGNHQIVEFAYQRTKNFERLSFLYLITGNLEKLNKMLKIAEMRGDIMGRFHNALYLGDVRERVKILEEAGQLPLAYACAATHGLEEDAARIATVLTDAGKALPQLPPPASATLMLPPAPLLRDDNWPLLTISKGFFDGGGAIDAGPGGEGISIGLEDMAEAGGAGWGDDLDLGLPSEGGARARGGDDDEDGEGGEGGDEDGGWEMEDLELPADAGASAAAADDGGVFVAPAPGAPAANKWTQRSSLAGEHAAAGAYDTALRLLSRQLGIVNFAPLKPLLLDAALASHAALLPLAPGQSPLWLPLGRGWSADAPVGPPSSPALFTTLTGLEDQLKAAYKLTTEGKFSDALKVFTGILHAIPLLVVETRKEVDEVKELLGVARDYCLALRIELKRKELKDEPTRNAELAAYFTHCNLQPIHLSLSLRSAMSVFYKLHNFATAAGFARRLLELNPPAAVATQAKQLLATCERTPKDEAPVAYDARNPFVTCAATLTPIYRGHKDAACPYCGAKHVPEHAGSVCALCDLGKVGAEASGLMCSPSQVR